jgi:RNA polymerase sigma factor (sigma-70 family)
MQKRGMDEYWQIVWTNFKSGDQEAFAILYNHHIDPLYHFGTKLCKDTETVKDSLQELFLELYLKREKLNVGHENIKYYLLLALKRNLIKKLKAGRKSSQRLLESVDFEPEYSIEFQMMEQEKEDEINQKIVKTLKQLPSKQREAIYLRFNESLEYSEIAKILDINVESVRKQVYRALMAIREMLKNEPFVNLFFLLKK